MEDFLITDIAQVAKLLNLSSRSIYRLVEEWKIPFLRTGFSEDNPRGSLYFSKVRLFEKNWDSATAKVEEVQEKELAIGYIKKELEMNGILNRLLDEEEGEIKVKEDLRGELFDDLNSTIEEMVGIRSEYLKLQKQRVINFFGQENAVIFFPGMFPYETKMRQAMTHEFYPSQNGNPEEIEAERLRQKLAEEKRRREYEIL